jgi:hypothetical protein
MDKGKYLFYEGFVLIAIGIVLRFLPIGWPLAVWFFIAGALLKTLYLYMAYKRGQYNPGAELLFLAAGLGVLMFGAVLRNSQPDSVFGPALIALALVLKGIFVFMLVRKMQALRLQVVALASKARAINRASGLQ